MAGRSWATCRRLETNCRRCRCGQSRSSSVCDRRSGQFVDRAGQSGRLHRGAECVLGLQPIRRQLRWERRRNRRRIRRRFRRLGRRPRSDVAARRSEYRSGVDDRDHPAGRHWSDRHRAGCPAPRWSSREFGSVSCLTTSTCATLSVNRYAPGVQQSPRPRDRHVRPGVDCRVRNAVGARSVVSAGRETIAITLNGVATNASLGANGAFSASLDILRSPSLADRTRSLTATPGMSTLRAHMTAARR